MCIRDRVRSRYGDQAYSAMISFVKQVRNYVPNVILSTVETTICLLYTSDAADDLLCVDLGGRRIIKKKKNTYKKVTKAKIIKIHKSETSQTQKISADMNTYYILPPHQYIFKTRI